MAAPWFKFYPADYLSDAKVRQLSRFHRSMLLDCWCIISQEGSIPSDPKELSLILGEGPKRCENFLKVASKLFQNHPEDDSKLISNRLAKELEKYNQKVDRLRENGRKGGRPQKQIRKQIEKAIAREPESEPEKDLNISPKTERKTRKPSPEKREPTRIEEVCQLGEDNYTSVLWDVLEPFPRERKTWPLTIAKCFMKAIRDGTEPKAIYDAALALSKTRDPQYMPDAAKWLSEEGWKAYATG